MESTDVARSRAMHRGAGIASCVEQDPRQGVVCCTRWSSPESYPSLEAKLSFHAHEKD